MIDKGQNGADDDRDNDSAFGTFLLKATDNAKLKSSYVIVVSPSLGNLNDHKNLHPDIPSAEECELFESILQTKWPELLKDTSNVKFQAFRNAQAPHISTVIWEFPDAATRRP